MYFYDEITIQIYKNKLSKKLQLYMYMYIYIYIDISYDSYFVQIKKIHR